MSRFALVASVASLAAGCVIHVDRHTEADAIVLDGAIDTVVADLAGGDRVVSGGGVGPARVERVWGWTGGRPQVLAHVDGGTLTLEVRCEGSMLGTCRVDHTVILPASAAVLGTTGSGNVELSDVGHVDVSTGSGDLTLDGVDGDVHAETGSGEVFGRGLASDDVWVDTGSGDVDLALLLEPSSVSVTTGSGDVRLALPPGSYDLSASTSSGDVHVSGVDVEPGADAKVEVHTGSGDVVVTSR